MTPIMSPNDLGEAGQYRTGLSTEAEESLGAKDPHLLGGS